MIPLLEREERALRDARAGLDGYDSEGNPLAESSTSSNNVVYGVPRHAERVTPHMTTQTRGTIEYRTSAGDGHLP